MGGDEERFRVGVELPIITAGAATHAIVRRAVVLDRTFMMLPLSVDGALAHAVLVLGDVLHWLGRKNGSRNARWTVDEAQEEVTRRAHIVDAKDTRAGCGSCRSCRVEHHEGVLGAAGGGKRGARGALWRPVGVGPAAAA